MRGGESDALHTGHCGDVMNQRCQVHHRPVGHGAGIGIDVLTQQQDLADTLARECAHLIEHRLERAADLIAARIRHDAKAAVLAAALHDRHRRPGAQRARLRQAIEFLDFRKAHVDYSAAARPELIEHLRQAVNGLRPEHQVDERRPRTDRRAFLAGDTAADADDQLRSQQLESAPLTEQRVHLLLCLLAHRAGVHQQHVGVRRILGRRQTHSRAQHVRHTRGIVLIHLATKGLDVEEAGHCLAGLDSLRVTVLVRPGNARDQVDTLWAVTRSESIDYVAMTSR